MSSPNDRPSDWVQDAKTGEWIRWDAQRKAWVDRDRRKVNAPALSSASASAPSGSKQSTASRRPSSTKRDTSLHRVMKKTHLRDAPSEAATSQTAASDSSRASHASTEADKAARTKKASVQGASAPREFYVEDSKTGLRTHWKISQPQKYIDPGTQQSRSLTLKHFPKGENEREDKGGKGHGEVKKGRAFGKVIEKAIVPLKGISGASALMSELPGGENDGVRWRRFVVVEESPEGRNCFRALAIKTYNGDGVTHQIKHHHSQIYVGRTIPDVLRGELPGLRNGQMERPMQPQAIRVETYDRHKTLDPISRLDYCDRNDFDYDDPQVRLFGRVHKDSEVALHSQYLNVMRGVAAAIRGPSNPDRSTHSDSSGDSDGDSRPQAPQRERTASIVRGPSTSGGATRFGAPQPLQRALTSNSQPATAAGEAASSRIVEEKISIERMEAIIRNLEEYAEEHRLRWPANIGREGIKAMANDRHLRETKVKEIAAILKREKDRA